MTTTTTSHRCTVTHDDKSRWPEPCWQPATRYLLLAYPAGAPALDPETELRGEFVCPRHHAEARVFARPPFARIVTDLGVA